MKRLLCGTLTAMLISLPLYAGGGSHSDDAQKMEDSSAVGTESSMDESTELGSESEDIQKMEDSQPVDTESSDIEKMEDSPSLDSGSATDEVQMEEEDPSMMDSEPASDEVVE